MAREKLVCEDETQFIERVHHIYSLFKQIEKELSKYQLKSSKMQMSEAYKCFEKDVYALMQKENTLQ